MSNYKTMRQLHECKKEYVLMYAYIPTFRTWVWIAVFHIFFDWGVLIRTEEDTVRR